jgi:polysaccharide biosynthesis/export protein
VSFRKAFLIFTFVAVVTLSAVAQMPTPAIPGVSSAASPHFSGQVVSSGGVFPIGVGDLIEIGVFDTPEMSGQLRVDPKGNVTMPLLGSVHVAGMRTDEAQKLFQQKLVLADLVKEPQVSVFIREYATQGVSVWGEVKSPGVYPVLGNRRISDLISMAQGTTAAAGFWATVTRRDDPNKPMHVDLRAADNPGQGSSYELQPGDTLQVERAGIVYVLGDVSKPGGFVMDHDNVTVLQALAFALGPTRTASLGKARLLRKTPNGFEQQALPLKDILTAKKDDPLLRADDIIYVPSSTAKTTMQYGLQGVLSSAASAAIYTLR